MKHYDYIALGTGSALTVVQGLLSHMAPELFA
jgi:hypothetical protein